MERLIVRGHGTAESEWLSCAALANAPDIQAHQLVPEKSRAVVVSPHPDDEVLALGGLLSLLARIGRAACVVAVTDGDASHRGSTQWSPERLAQERPREQALAMSQLGWGAETLHRLHLPDGQVQARRAELTALLGEIIEEGDVVFTPWSLDGHPDHEAVAQAAIRAADMRHATLVEVPIWGWHWANPQHARWPMHRARCLALDADAMRRKRLAMAAFQSQLQFDASTGAEPVLDAGSLTRSRRPFEVLFV